MDELKRRIELFDRISNVSSFKRAKSLADEYTCDLHEDMLEDQHDSEAPNQSQYGSEVQQNERVVQCRPCSKSHKSKVGTEFKFANSSNYRAVEKEANRKKALG